METDLLKYTPNLGGPLTYDTVSSHDQKFSEHPLYKDFILSQNARNLATCFFLKM